MKRTWDSTSFNIIGFFIVSFFALAAVLPFILLVSSSVQSESMILQKGFSLWPRELSGEAYKFIFMYPENILRSYGVTIGVTVFGTSFSLFLSSMAAYVLQRKDVKYRNKLAFFIYFTTLFNGGIVPYYIMLVKTYRLKDTILVLILSNLFNVIYILIIRNYINGSIPDAMSESAKVDGANDFVIFIRIILPLMKPALASIGLFTALIYWNDWWTGMMFIESDSKTPLQYALYKVLNKTTFAAEFASRAGVSIGTMPKETMKLALTVVATGPIIIAYPFVQKYFVSGITIGAVKG